MSVNSKVQGAAAGKLIPTLFFGGAGSRIWPVSRELHPKPFIRLADGRSLLQKAFLRGAQLPGAKENLTVSNRELFSRSKTSFIFQRVVLTLPLIAERHAC